MDDPPGKSGLLKNREAIPVAEEQEVVCQREAKIKDLDDKRDVEELQEQGNVTEIAKRMEEIRRGPKAMIKSVVKKTAHGLRKVNQAST